ncbi:MAG: hypothetical protein ACK2TV_09595 [Anaerolineales bacterium]
MTFPAIVFSFFVATLLASLLHLWRGGGLFKLIWYLILSWIGFFGGHLLAGSLSWKFLDVGTIHFGMGLLGSIAFLAVGYWLGQLELDEK